MKKIILMGFPNHRNLGDQAIALAEEIFIRKNFPEYDFYSVPEGIMLKCVYKVRKACTDEDILVLHGGGNFGNQYMYIEESRRKILELFPNNPIILMPQSIYFSNDEEGKKELNKTIKAYNKHKNFTIVAREQISYDKIKENFTADVLQTPDIVMSLNKQRFDEKRNGIMYILRHDVEVVLDDTDRNDLINVGKKLFDDVIVTDMMFPKQIKDHEREEVLDTFMANIGKRQVVVTDRLHGMIFCAITGTPCIVFSNYNHKVKGSLKWLKHLNYIRFLDDISKTEETLKELLTIKETKYDNEEINKSLEQIVNKIKMF